MLDEVGGALSGTRREEICLYQAEGRILWGGQFCPQAGLPAGTAN